MIEHCSHCPVSQDKRPCRAVVTGHWRFCQLTDPEHKDYSEDYVRLVAGYPKSEDPEPLEPRPATDYLEAKAKIPEQPRRQVNSLQYTQYDLKLKVESCKYREKCSCYQALCLNLDRRLEFGKQQEDPNVYKVTYDDCFKCIEKYPQ